MLVRISVTAQKNGTE